MARFSYKRALIPVLFILTGFASIFARPAYADCARPSTMDGNVTLTASCSYDYTIDGVDNPQNTEGSSTNTATITLGNYNLTISSGQTIAGRFVLTGSGGIALGSGSIKPGGAIWIYDNDADGWLTDYTNNSYRRTSTAAGYRRLGLMRSTTSDCNDSSYSTTNSCYSYSQSTYYAYGQASYYAYSESKYYAYSESTYYAYSQTAYYAYGQSTYYAYSQGTYYAYGQSTYYAYSESAYYAYGQSTYYSYSQGPYYSYSYSYGQSAYYLYSQNSYCFTADTRIRMANGTYKKIKDILPGDVIASWNFERGEIIAKTVTKHFSRTTSGGYYLINGTLQVTGSHPMWAQNRQSWIHAESLIVGDTLMGIDGKPVIVHSIEFHGGTYPVYNLSVEGPEHNFFTEDVLVHNKI